MRFPSRPGRALAAAFASSVALQASAARINVDFNSGGSPTQSGAALLGAAGDVWNGVEGSPSASNVSLVDSANAPTPVKLSFVSTGAFDDANNSFAATPYADLMRDYVYASQGTTGSINLSGLSPGAYYDLVLYSNPNQGRVRSTEFTVGGAGKVANSVGTASVFTEGVNYVRFPSARSDASGNLSVAYAFAAGAGNLEGNVNGFQLDAGVAPTPTGLINIDFKSGGAPRQSGAALLGAAGDIWNGVNGSPGASNVDLVDSGGGPSAAKLSFTSSGAFDDASNSFSATPYADLMRDYVYASQGTTGSISLSGLEPGGAYEVILYSNPNQNRVRSTEFTVNGLSEVAASVGTASAFTEGVNYVGFERVFADASGNLNIAYKFAAGAGNLEGNVNGLQVRPAAVPEPAALGVMAAAAVGLLARRRRRGLQ